jgi:hypothetical protein
MVERRAPGPARTVPVGSGVFLGALLATVVQSIIAA